MTPHSARFLDTESTQPMRYIMSVSNGNRYALTAPTLVGRNPEPEPGEEDYNIVIVADPQRTLSKTHLLLGADSAGPYVVDRNSTNGTVVTLPDNQQIICGPRQTVRFSAGTTILCGQFTIRIELQL